MTGSRKIAVVGAGAMGGMLGGLLASHGEDVTFIARGETLAALKRGFTMIDPAGARHTPPVKALAIEDAGPFDLVILCLKANQIAAAATTLSRLFHEDTPVLAVLNGIPWWYFHKSGGPFEGRTISAVDPDGAIAKAIDGRRVIGGVIYAAANVPQAGVVHVTGTQVLHVGEPDGSLSARVTDIAELLNRAAFKTVASADIRTDIWTKVWGNSSFNPVSALTGAGLSTIARDPGACEVARGIMREVQQVVEALGLRMKVSLEERLKITEALGNHKTSMLQDIEAKRFPEIDANMGAVAEIAQMVGVPTPMLTAIMATTRLLARRVTGAVV